jgi:crotonobetainyl-CoA:carnitine CoA-transferase CaiB-like acyl-CoA transferase
MDRRRARARELPERDFRGSGTWCRRLEALDVPHAPMYDSDEVPDDPQARHLQLFVDAAHPAGGRWTTVRSPVSFDGERALQVSAPPLLGDHDAALRSDASIRSAPRDGDGQAR